MNGPCKWHSEPGKPPPPPSGGNDRDNRGKRPADAAGGSRDNFPNSDATYVISVIEHNDKRSQRRRWEEVHAVMPDVQQLMNWSKQPIAFGPKDHPDIMPTPGGYCLILDPTIVAGRLTCTFSKVLVDGGSSINILYEDTEEKLGIRESDRLPS